MITWQDTILRLVAAAILGGLVGMERQRYDWAAGLRTHMLVCLGSALIMIVSMYGFSDILGTPNVTLDPSRVAAQVISGIGFLGAGTILFLKHEVIKGLTTAAGLWTVAGIGLAVGGGLYLAAAITTILVLIILVVIKPYKERIRKNKNRRELELIVNNELIGLQQIDSIIKANKLHFSDITIRHANDPNFDIIYLRFSRDNNYDILLKTVDLLKATPGVQK